MGLSTGLCLTLHKEIDFGKQHIKYLCVIVQFTLNKFASIVFPLHLCLPSVNVPATYLLARIFTQTATFK